MLNNAKVDGYELKLTNTDMKKYLFIALALLGMASCAKDDLGNGKKPHHNGEVEESYIAINLAASDITRAEETTPVFQDGEAAERAVSHVDFFFFDGAGNPFPVKVNDPNDGTTSAPGGNVNHLRAVDISFTADGNAGDDISDSSNAVLLLRTYKGEYPSQIVAVLNWSPDDATAYSLEDLKEAVNIQGTFKNSENVDTDYFVMSNAVYAQGTTPVYATPLTMENIKTSETDAKNAPVNIYVERVAAKVVVTANAEYDLNKTADYKPIGETNTVDTKVYAQILGWDLYRDNSQSTLLKVIDGGWTDDAVGFNWNDSPWYRSYWAMSLPAPDADSIYGTGFNSSDCTYIGENTNGKALCTKVVIKAQLVNDADEPLDLAIWNNVQYVDEADATNPAYSLRVAVANTLKNTYFAMTTDGSTTTYTGIAPEDLQCVMGGTAEAPNGVAANEVYFQLSPDGEAKNWHKLVGGAYQPMTADSTTDANGAKATNAALKSVPAAVLYESGMTYYYVDIKHLGAPASAAEYGIVRNHIYDININSIGGYGSPVYTGTEFIEYPQVSDQESFVAAKINILSWRLVSQSVNIQPQN